MTAPPHRDGPLEEFLQTTDQLKRELLRRAPSPAGRPVAWTTSLALIELIVEQVSGTPEWQLVQSLLDRLLPEMQGLLPTDWEHTHPDEWILLFDAHNCLRGLATNMSARRG